MPHGGFLTVQYLRTSLTVVTFATTLACRGDVINGWPQGHAILEGSVLRRGGVPYEGELFVSCDESGALRSTQAPGSYRIELSWSFPAGVPADSLTCQVRAGQPGFSASRRVLFVPAAAPARTHILDVVEP